MNKVAKIFPATRFTAFFPKDGLGLRAGIERFTDFLRRIDHISGYLSNLKIGDPDTDERISPLFEFDKYVRAWEEMRLPNDGDVFSTVVSKNGDEPAASSVRYQWGNDWSLLNDQLEITIYRPLEGATLNTTLVRKLYDEIIKWRRPSFVQGGPPNPMIYQKVFSSRTSSGWASWVPEPITHADLPMAHTVEPLEGGSLIFATPEPFGWRMEDYGQEIAKMQDVEVGLNDLLLLPEYDMEEDWTSQHRDAYR